MLLLLDPIVERSRHKSIIPDSTRLAKFIVKRSWIFIVIFCVVLGPAVFGYTHTKLYYNMASTLPKTINFMVSNEKVMNDYNIGTTHIVIANSDIKAADGKKMTEELQKVKGVKDVLGYDSLVGNQVPQEMVPNKLLSNFKSGQYQMLLINTTKDYGVATTKVNNQLTTLNKIVKSFDKKATVIGEAAATKDLMNTTSRDFKVVDLAALLMIFFILFIIFRSWIHRD